MISRVNLDLIATHDTVALVVFYICIILGFWLLPQRCVQIARHVPPNYRIIIKNGVRVLLIVLAVVGTFSILGIQAPAIATGLILAAIGANLASAGGTVQSGLVVLLSSTPQIGDELRVISLMGEHEGVVTNITLDRTMIKDGTGQVIQVPNTQIANAILIVLHSWRDRAAPDTPSHTIPGDAASSTPTLKEIKPSL